MEVINIHELSKSFENKILFSKQNLTFEHGKIHSITGPSGCGKTTLLRIIAGLESYDSGQITGVPSDISMVFQSDLLCDSFSALDNVKLVLRNASAIENAKELLTTLGLDPNSKQPVQTYSGGMRRRVSLARALAVPFDLLLLDEPFEGLDAKSREKAIQLLLQVAANKTILLVSHNPEDAKDLQAISHKF